MSLFLHSCIVIFLLDKPASVTSHHVLYIWSLPVSTLSTHSWVDRWCQFHFENEDEQFKRFFFFFLASIKEPLSVNHAGSRGWDALRNRIAQSSFWHLTVWSELKIHFLFNSWYVSVRMSLGWLFCLCVMIAPPGLGVAKSIFPPKWLKFHYNYCTWEPLLYRQT